MLSDIRIEANTTKESCQHGHPITGLLSNFGRAVLFNAHTGSWLHGSEKLYSTFADMNVDDLLDKYPALRSGLIERSFARKSIAGLNPWTLKVADHCNMACHYCYEDAHPKEKKMSIETADKVIDEMLATGQRDFEVLFHGGEPTLNMPIIRHVVRQLRERLVGDGKVSFRIHSNLYYLSDSLHDELKSLGIGIGSSMDGTRAMHNLHRVNLKNSDTYDRIRSNVMKLNDRYLILTVTKDNQGQLLEAAEHFVKDLQVDGFHFLPLLPHGRPKVRDMLPDPQVMCRQVIEVCDYIIRRFEAGRFVKFRNLNSVIGSLYRGTFTDACSNCIKLSSNAQSITINYDGTFGPCDITASLPGYAMGRIQECNGNLTSVMQNRRNFRFSKNLDRIQPCKTCPFKCSCAGGCDEESLEPGESASVYCDYYYQLYSTVALALPDIEKNGYTSRVLTRQVQLVPAPRRFLAQVEGISAASAPNALPA